MFSARFDSFLSKAGFTADTREVTDVKIPHASVIEKNNLPFAFKSFSKSIPERARMYVVNKVLEKDRSPRCTSQHKTGSPMEAGLQLKNADTPTDHGDMVVGPFVSSGHEPSWKPLYQQVKAFNMLSPLDKNFVTICMLERWLGCKRSEVAFSSCDLEPKEGLGDLYWALKRYVARELVLGLDNSRLAEAVAEDFDSLYHEDKRVVMLTNIEHWMGEAESGLKEYLQEFFQAVHRFWSHDWSRNCATKVGTS